MATLPAGAGILLLHSCSINARYEFHSILIVLHMVPVPEPAGMVTRGRHAPLFNN
jgi:hypothetical protein